jgi:RimJ/RimL family protein N-acetyltransferase
VEHFLVFLHIHINEKVALKPKIVFRVLFFIERIYSVILITINIFGEKKMQDIEFMNIIRETERLIIRPTREDDFEIISTGLKGQLAKQNKYDDEELEFVDIYTKAFCKHNVESIKQSAINDKAYLFRVFKRDDGAYIGGVIIKPILRKHFQWAELGYWLLNQHWGKGYGSEMAKAAIDIAFRDIGLHRIEAQINLDNVASQKTAEKAGMKLECIRKGFIYEFDEWTDNMIYVINKQILR